MNNTMRNRSKRFNLLWLLLAMGWMAFTWWVFTWPLPQIPTLPIPLFPGLDLVIHFFMFAVLGYIWSRVFQYHAIIALLLLVTLTMYGYFTEWQQLWIPGRHSSILDFFANAAGVFSGVLIGALTRMKK